MRSQKGFTLMELMVVVVIIGILSAVSLPVYKDYVIRGKIPDATSNLAIKRTAMEQYFQDNLSYLSGATCPASATESSATNFTFSCGNMSKNTYTITATGIGSMSGFSYTIDQSNVKTSTIANPAPSGWIGNSTSCWITKAGGVC